MVSVDTQTEDVLLEGIELPATREAVKHVQEAEKHVQEADDALSDIKVQLQVREARYSRRPARSLLAAATCYCHRLLVFLPVLTDHCYCLQGRV